jgi:VWFA-related protein
MAKPCLLAAILSLSISGMLPLAAQNADFAISHEEVMQDVLVMDKGRPVQGLTAADFQVFDNGVLQEVASATLQNQTPITVVFVFDISRSVSGELLFHLKNAAAGILSDLKADDHAALVTFNNAVVLGAMPTRSFSFVKAALEQVRPFGNSSLYDGTYAGLMLAQTRPDPTLVIIFSDGRDTFSWLTGKAVLEAARRNDAVVYAVSPGRISSETPIAARSLLESPRHNRNHTFLNELTESTGGSLMKTDSNADLAKVFRSTLEEFRQRYRLTYTPRGVAESGWHKLEVRLRSRAATIQARSGYVRNLAGK